MGDSAAARRLPPPRLLPWSSWEEWRACADALAPVVGALQGPHGAACFLPSTTAWRGAAAAALAPLTAWLVRGRAPLVVATTHSLLSLLLEDAEDAAGSGWAAATGAGYPSAAAAAARRRSADECRRLALAMALTRLVNGLADAGQRGAYAQSVADLCARIGLPRVLVDARHEAAHGSLPSLPSLRAAAGTALGWMLTNYWAAQRARVARLWEEPVGWAADAAAGDDDEEAEAAGGTSSSLAPPTPALSGVRTLELILEVGASAWASVTATAVADAAVRSALPVGAPPPPLPEAAWFDVVVGGDAATHPPTRRPASAAAVTADRPRRGVKRGLDGAPDAQAAGGASSTSARDAAAAAGPWVALDASLLARYRKAVGRAVATATQEGRLASKSRTTAAGGGVGGPAAAAEDAAALQAAVRLAVAAVPVPRPPPVPATPAPAHAAGGVRPNGTGRGGSVLAFAPRAVAARAETMRPGVGGVGGGGGGGGGASRGAAASPAPPQAASPPPPTDAAAALTARLVTGLRDPQRGGEWVRRALLQPLVTARGGLLTPPHSGAAGWRSGAVACTLAGVSALQRGWVPILLRLVAAHPPLHALLVSALLGVVLDAPGAAREAASRAPQPAGADVRDFRTRAFLAVAWLRALLSRHWAALARSEWGLAVRASPVAARGGGGGDGAAAGVAVVPLLDRPEWSAGQAAFMARPAPPGVLAGLAAGGGRRAGRGRRPAPALQTGAGAGTSTAVWLAPDVGALPALTDALARALRDPLLRGTATLRQLRLLTGDAGVDVASLRADAAATLMGLSREPEPRPDAAPVHVAGGGGGGVGAGGGGGALLDLASMEALLGGGDDGAAAAAGGVETTGAGSAASARGAADGAVAPLAAPRRRPRWTVGVWPVAQG